MKPSCKAPYRVVALGSGAGSNIQAVLKSQKKGTLGTAKVVGLFSDSPKANMLKLGVRYGIPARYLDAGPFKTKFSPEAESEWTKAISDLEPQLIVLAGFMRVLKGALLEAFEGRIINLHPSLLPNFPGLNAIGQALGSGAKKTGCTVHFVNATIDGGKIIAQKAVDIKNNESLESLTAKVHAAEHQLLPEVIRNLAHAWQNLENKA